MSVRGWLAASLGRSFTALAIRGPVRTSHGGRIWRHSNARRNFVDHGVTDQSSVLRFIEDNWNLGRIGNSSFDALAGSLGNMFDFDTRHPAHRLILDPNTGEQAGWADRAGWE